MNWQIEYRAADGFKLWAVVKSSPVDHLHQLLEDNNRRQDELVWVQINQTHRPPRQQRTWEPSQ